MKKYLYLIIAAVVILIIIFLTKKGSAAQIPQPNIPNIPVIPQAAEVSAQPSAQPSAIDSAPDIFAPENVFAARIQYEQDVNTVMRDDIKRFYQVALYRAPSDEEINSWIPDYKSLGAEKVFEKIQNSPEGFVKYCYVKYLHRLPQGSEADGWYAGAAKGKFSEKSFLNAARKNGETIYA